MRLIDADALEPSEMIQPLGNGRYEYARIVYMNDIDEMPTIEPERKTEKWKERKVHDEKIIEEWQSARCSVCGKYHTTPYLYYFDEYKFCPHCGADMRGGEDD